MMRRLFEAFLLVCVLLGAASSPSAAATTAARVQAKTEKPRAAEASQVPVKVDTRAVENLPVGREIVAALRQLPYVSRERVTHEDWHLRLKPNSSGTSVVVERASGSVVAEQPLANRQDLVRAVVWAAEREAVWRAVRYLENASPDSKMKVELRVVPVTVEMGDDGLVAATHEAEQSKLAQVEQGEFLEGDYFQFEVKNSGPADAYLTIVDLLADGRMHPMFPVSMFKADNKVPADGRWHRIPAPYVYRVTPPFGFEFIKAFATEEPTDLSAFFEGGLTNHRHAPQGGALGEYFSKLPNSFAKTRVPGNWAATTLTFQSVKQGSLYVLSVGVSKYHRPGLPGYMNLWDLETENDVRELSDTLRGGGRKTFDTVNVKTLYDGEATRESIVAAFQDVIARIKPRDTFVFHFSGHAGHFLAGGQKQPQLILIPFDYDPKNLVDTGITNALLQTFITQIQARNQLVVLDASFSTAGFEGLIERFDRENKELEGLLRRNLWVLGFDEKTTAKDVVGDDNKKYGLLTYSLLKGLNGGAGGRDGKISVRDLFEFSRSYVAARGGNVKLRTWFSGEDFALADAPEKVGRRPSQPRRPPYVPAAFAEAPPRAAPDPTTRVALGLGQSVTNRSSKPVDQSRDQKQDEAQDKTRVRAEVTSAPDPNYVRRGKNYALLVATDEYGGNWPDLSNPVRDAETVAEELRRFYDFEIDPDKDILRNPTKGDFFKALHRITDRAYDPDDQLFIFVAGHGHYNKARNEGYLVFADSPALNREDELCENCDAYLSHSTLRKVLDYVKCNHIFLVLDACFSGTFDESVTRGAEDTPYEQATNMQMIRHIMQFKTRRFLTSGGKEYVPDGRPGQHSPFANRFIEALRSYGGAYGMLTINGILAHVERVVPTPRRGAWGDNESGSDFVFLFKKPKQ